MQIEKLRVEVGLPPTDSTPAHPTDSTPTRPTDSTPTRPPHGIPARLKGGNHLSFGDSVSVNLCVGGYTANV